MLLRTNEAADVLGLKAITLACWRMQRIGPKFVRMGRSVRYSEEDLRAFIASGTVTPGGTDYERNHDKAR
jgi:predicted DNA-binding transcriptional regulator AlpA